MDICSLQSLKNLKVVTVFYLYYGLLLFGLPISWLCKSLDLDMLAKFVRVISIKEGGSLQDKVLNLICFNKGSSFGMQL